MTLRLASIAAALVLGLAVPATSALAQSYTAPAGVDWQNGPRGYAPRDVETTGSLARQIDSSAKGGNAGQPERPVPQYGNTSGGPAR